MKKCLIFWSACALLVVTTACTKSSPARPTETSAAPAGEAVRSVTVNGITLTTPQLVTPTAGQRFKFADQQLTLTIKNAASTGSTPLTYTFQVANDANFTSMAYAKDGVAEGTGGQTSLKIDKLAGNKDYYWRVRSNSGGSCGPVLRGPVVQCRPRSRHPGADSRLAGQWWIAQRFRAARRQQCGQERTRRSPFISLRCLRFVVVRIGHLQRDRRRGERTDIRHHRQQCQADGERDLFLARAGGRSFERCLGSVLGDCVVQVRAVRYEAGDDREFAAGPGFVGRGGEDHEHQLLAGRVRSRV